MLFRRALLIIALLTTLSAIPAGPTEAASTRSAVPLTTGWRFHLGEAPGASAAAFDDRSWATVTVPHTWNAVDGSDATPGYHRGEGWYRRFVTVPAGGVSYLEFDAAGTVADVYVNGALTTTHRGGYSRFRAPLGTAPPGSRVVVAVRVDNSADPTVAPLSTDWVEYGGLYRAVRLITTDRVHIDLMDHGGPGVYVRTAGGQVTVRTRLVNEERFARRVRLDLSAGGAADSVPVELPAGATVEVIRTLRIPHPRLWRARTDPYLYRLRADVRVPGRGLLDTVTQPLGLRTVAVDPDRGFLLNGRSYPLHGVNLHQGRVPEGFAVSPRELAADMDTVREIGANTLRLAHYQHDQYVYDRADRDGLVLWTEIPYMHSSVDDPAFRANVRSQLTELILQNFNHPSVAFWGIGNEVTFKLRDDPNPVLADLDALTRQLDPDRIDSYATCCVPDDDPSVGHADATGYHRYEGWYFGTPDLFGAWADHNHAAQPNKPFAVTEYGGGASPAQHIEDLPVTETPFLGPAYEERQTAIHIEHWAQIRQRPYLFASWAFVLFDFPSDGRAEGDVPGLNNKGLVTADRSVRKDAFYFYKANWNPEPMVYLAERRFTRRTVATTDVTAFANTGPVTLYVNGMPVGTRVPDDLRVVTWPVVRLTPGDNDVRLVARSGSRTLIDSARWTVS